MKERKRLAIITNIPAPYRVDFFHYLQQHEKEYEIHIIYAVRMRTTVPGRLTGRR